MKTFTYGLLAVGLWAAQAGAASLFDYGHPAAGVSQEVLDRAVQASHAHLGSGTSVAVNEAAFGPKPQTVTVALPDGETVDVVQENTTVHPSGSRSFYGHISGCSTCRAVFTLGRNGAAFGSINTATHDYHLVSSKAGPVLVETDAVAADSLMGDVGVTAPVRVNAAHKAPARAITESIVPTGTGPVTASVTAVPMKVLVVYGTDLVAAFPGAQLQTYIDNLVASVNSVYSTSNTGVTFSLGGQMEVPQDLSTYSDMSQMLSDADYAINVNNSTKFSAVEDMRATVGAQVVFVINHAATTNFCGLVNQVGGTNPNLTDSSGNPVSEGANPAYFNPALGYAALESFPACGSGVTAAHEAGHLMGAAHDAASGTNSVDTGGKSGAFSYSHGYDIDSKNTTVMGVCAGCTELPVFSSPTYTCNSGMTCGDATTADNRNTLLQTAPVVQAFTTGSMFKPTIINGSAFVRGGIITYKCAIEGVTGLTYSVVLEQNGSPVATLSSTYFDPLGCIDGINVTVPASAAIGGNYTLVLVPAANPAAAGTSATFTVGANVPNPGAVTAPTLGATAVVLKATASGSGSVATGQFTIKSGATTIATSGAVTVDPAGSFAAEAFVPGLSCGTAYTATFTVTSSGGSSSSGATGFSTLACGASAGFTGVSVDKSVAHAATVSATLTGPGAPVSNVILYGPVTTFGSTATASVVGSVLTYHLTNLACNKTYYYEVVGFSSTDGASTGELTFTTAPCAAGALAFSATSESVADGTAFVNLTVNRTGGSDGAVTVNYATADGTALNGTDYASGSGTLSWADGDTSSKTVTVFLLENPSQSGTLNMTTSLSAPTGGASASGTNTLTITQAAATLTANNGSVSTNENAAVNGTLSGASTGGGTLTYAVSQNPGHGSVSVTDATTGAFTYTPASGYNGSDSFQFTVSQGGVTSSPGVESVTVNASSSGGGKTGGGGGGGALSILALAGLGFATAARRRKVSA